MSGWRKVVVARWKVVDLPGAYSQRRFHLKRRSRTITASRKTPIVVNVVDATNLKQVSPYPSIA
jgi:Fe2+ transport system protein B